MLPSNGTIRKVGGSSTKPCFQDKKLSNSECLKHFFFYICKFRQYTISRRWWYKPRGSGKSSRAGKIKARGYQTGRDRKADKTQENGRRTRKYETRDQGQSELQNSTWRLKQKKSVKEHSVESQNFSSVNQFY